MRISLRVKVGLIIIGMVTLGGSLTAYWVYTDSTRALKDSISNGLAITASQTMDKIDRYLYERGGDLQALAGRQQLQNFLALPAAARSQTTADSLEKQFEDFQSISATWQTITIVDTQGRLPLSPPRPQNLESLLAKQPSVLTLYARAITGQSGYTDALSVGQNRQPIMLFMTPVRNEQAPGRPIVGIIAGEVAWQSTLSILRTLSGTEAGLINRQGLSLGDNQPDAANDVLTQDFSNATVFKDAQKGAMNGTGILPGLDKPQGSFLTAYAKESGYRDYHGNDWTLVLQTPTATAFASTQKLTRTLAYTYLTILILSVALFILVMDRQIIKPIELLKQAADKFAGESFAEPVQITSHDEIGQLAKAFNTMAFKLQSAYKALRLRTEEAESQQRLTHALLQSLPVGVMVVKAPSGEPIMINKMGEKLAGHGVTPRLHSDDHTPASVVIREDGSPYPPEELPINITLKTQKTTMRDDLLLRRPDGTILAVRAITSPIEDPDGKVSRAVSVFEDITKQRELERSREEFFSIASHELRTPLTAIRGNSSLIQKVYGDRLKDPELREMVDDIHTSAMRLIEIVNDFLDTSRLEQKHMNFSFEPVDLVANAESVMKEYQVTGSRQSVYLGVTPPAQPLPKVWADNNRVKQVFINLVGNALKFTNHGSVKISFEALPDSVKVLVSDTGHGMSAEAQKLLFKKFEQTGTTVLTRDSVRGTGLGLYISKMIIEQMHGHIQLVSSTPGMGTTFGFTLPLADSHSVESKAASDPQPGNS